MVSCTVSKSSLSGKLTAPPSLEIASRYIWGACIGEGGAIGNCPNHKSIKALMGIASSFGADIKFEKNTADIFGPGIPAISKDCDCESSMRASKLAIPLTFLSVSPTSIKNFSLPQKAFSYLDDMAAQLRIRITKITENIGVMGPPSDYILDLRDLGGTFWAPGLMMAMPFAQEPVIIILDDYGATHPSVANTIEALNMFSISHQYDSQECTISFAPSQSYPSRYFDVPADWRTGSYYLGAFALCGEGKVQLPSPSSQPEARFWEIFSSNGLFFPEDAGLSASIARCAPIKLPPTLDIRQYPALLPLAMVLATQAHTITKIGPLYPASPKTLKRAKIMAECLNRMGAKIQLKDSYLTIPYAKLKGGSIDCAGDGRIAMALVLAGLVSSSPLKITSTEALNELDSNFIPSLKSAGAKISLK